MKTKGRKLGVYKIHVIGGVFGDLTVIENCEPKLKAARTVLCKCSCGNNKIVRLNHLFDGHATSCGCKRKGRMWDAQEMGVCKEDYLRLCVILNGMKGRCHNPNVVVWARYGGRGIYVCDEWRKNTLAFIKWATDNGYRKGLEIDRINNDDGYTPTNCRWVTRKENMWNLRKNRIITYKGESKPMGEWAHKLGISYSCLSSRVGYGWSDERIISTPKNKKKYENSL